MLKIWQEQWPKLMHATIDSCIKHQSKLVFFDNVYFYDINSLTHMTEDAPINPPSKKGKVRKDIAEMLMKEAKIRKLDALIARAADFDGPYNDKSILNETVYKNIKKRKKT